MAIPDYPGLMQPALHALAKTSRAVPFEPLMADVASRLGLTAEELAERLPSGKETAFSNRLHWALAYLERTGVVQQSEGAYRTVLGPYEAAPTVSSSWEETEPVPRSAEQAGAAAPAKAKPEALMAANARIIRERLMASLLTRIHAGRPEVLERLIIDLMLYPAELRGHLLFSMAYAVGDFPRHLIGTQNTPLASIPAA